MIGGYITLEEHFSLSEDEKMSRGDVCLLMSYKEEFFNSIKPDVEKKYKLSTTYRKLCFGQLILIEQILSSKLPEFQKIGLCLSVFYRPIDETIYDNEDEDKEESIKGHWTSIPVGFALNLFDALMSSRDSFFYGQYNGVVYTKQEATSEEEAPVKREETYEDVFYRNFGWYERARTIGKELNMKPSEVNLMSADEAMMEIAYQVSKAKLTEYQNKNKKK